MRNNVVQPELVTTPGFDKNALELVTIALELH
jgi:hypothetical protein